MRVLKQGSTGADVKKWQFFLIGQGLESGKADGHFGPRTREATRVFQRQHGLLPDGVVGNKTAGVAMQLSFPVLTNTDPTKEGPNWPPKPSFPALDGLKVRQDLFGKFAFRAAPVRGNPGQIRILGEWVSNNIVTAKIPQLADVSGAPAPGAMQFHRLAVPQLQAVWLEWESAGLVDRVLSFGGSFAPRFVRGSKTTLSNHAFGTAFDINVAQNKLGAVPALVGEVGCVRELVPIANKHGFFWGGHFKSRLDGMHFEVARLV